MIRDLRGKAVLDSPDLSADVGSVYRELAGALTAAGLYLVPRKTLDAVLPIRIAPTPAAIERVFVGRVEVFSPSMQRTIETALASGDTKTLATYGRFLRPFCDRPAWGGSRVRIRRQRRISWPAAITPPLSATARPAVSSPQFHRLSSGSATPGRVVEAVGYQVCDN